MYMFLFVFFNSVRIYLYALHAGLLLREPVRLRTSVGSFVGRIVVVRAVDRMGIALVFV